MEEDNSAGEGAHSGSEMMHFDNERQQNEDAEMD